MHCSTEGLAASWGSPRPNLLAFVHPIGVPWTPGSLGGTNLVYSGKMTLNDTLKSLEQELARWLSELKALAPKS